jgi:hypothetical protein
MLMTSSLYETVCLMAEGDLQAILGSPAHLVGDGILLPDVGNAVYVVTDESGEVIYVGSVARRDPVKSRLLEHLRDGEKRSAWRNVWVVPLRAETQKERVRFLEGRIGRRLGYRGRLPSYHRAVSITTAVPV